MGKQPVKGEKLKTKNVQCDGETGWNGPEDPGFRDGTGIGFCMLFVKDNAPDRRVRGDAS